MTANEQLTEKEWEKICRDCSHPNLHVALIEYANTPEYLRRIILRLNNE